MDATDGGQQLKRLRQRRGWSWTDQALAIKDMAARLGLDRPSRATTASIRRAIARWESGTASTPDDHYQWLMAHVFAQRDGRVELGPRSEFAGFLTALAALGVAPGRVAEVQDAVTEWAECSRAARIRRPALDGADADTAVAETALAFEGISRRARSAPFARTQLAVAPFIELFADAERISAAGHELAARCYALAARVAFELRDDAAADQYYRSAITHASRLEDRWLSGAIHTSLAMVTMHRSGELDRAESIAHQAVHATRAGSSTRTRARALCVQAEIAARRGMERPAKAALDMAHSHLADPTTPDDPAAHSFDAARLAGFTGLCHMLTHQSDNAAVELEHACTRIPAHSDPVQLAIVLADLAQTRLRSANPDPEAAVAHLHKCGELAARTRGRVPMQRIHIVRRALRPWNGERFVASLDDHLYTVMLA